MTPFFTGFTPRQISGLGLWLDSTDSSTFSFSSGSNISQWRDKSGSSNHFSLTSGTTTTILDNGKTVVNFPSGAIMSSANQITFTTSSAFYIVSRLTTTNSIVMLLGFTNIGNGGGSDGDFSIRFVSSALHGTIAQGNNQDFANRTYYVNGSFDPSFGSNVYLNVYSIIGTVAPLVGGTSFLTLSSSFMSRFFIGYVAEFLYYPAGVTSTQRQQIESYLAQKWGLTASLPGGHSHATQPAGAVTLTALTNFRTLPRIQFASTGLVITHQDGRTWKTTANATGYANYSIGLNSGTPMTLNIYAGADVFNSAGGRVALLNNGDSNNAVRHAGYVMWTYIYGANNFDYSWKFVSSGSGYLIYNDYPSYNAWQVSYDSGSDRVLIVAPNDGRYGVVWNVTPKVTLAYVYSSY
jgi:hypothetical protein